MGDMMSVEHQYLESHPWISFKINLGKIPNVTWMRLGEALSKCDHIAGVPLKPAIAAALHQIYLVKGVHATTQIEGNTLSEAEVQERLAGRLKLPPSQEYLGVELDNVANGCKMVIMELAQGFDMALTAGRIKQFNKIVLEGLSDGEEFSPGEIRRHSVLVGNVYRGAPAEECEYLLDRLCGWLHDLCVDLPAEYIRPVKILRAMLAHLYLAWIHPFGDGNGRTARLVEFQLLIEAGLPTPACHLLSNYYNRTRSRYYQVLASTSRPPYPVEGFLEYALEGLVEELREQLEKILAQQLEVAWVNYVHELLPGHNPTSVRRRNLVLALPVGNYTPTSAIRRLTPELAESYADKGDKTVSRDVNALLGQKLIQRTQSGVRPLAESMMAFMPLRQMD
jgi:Fic family protein